MPDTSPTPVDGFDAADDLVTASLRDYMATLPGQNWSAEDAPDLALHVVNELDDKGLLRSRASIGPDSERIRELEAENRIAVGQLEHVTKSIERDRAAGLLPGPDDIVVNREAHKLAGEVLEGASQHTDCDDCWYSCSTLTCDESRASTICDCGADKAAAALAALSQPHPEETP